MNNDDIHDELPGLIAELDQHLATVPQLARVMAAEYLALVDQGVASFSAAIIIGQRYRVTN